MKAYPEQSVIDCLPINACENNIENDIRKTVFEKTVQHRTAKIGAVLCAAWFTIYAAYVYSLFCGTAIDSDFSNLVLEAADFLSGNVFLDGWVQTGISFLTTDFIYFCIGVLIAGISPTAFVIACTLMFLVFTIPARLLMRTPVRGYTFLKELMFLAIAGIPCAFSLISLRSHVGCMIWVMAAFLVLMRAEETTNRTKRILWFAAYIAFLTLACIGDAIGFIVGIAPLLVVSSIRYFRNDKRYLQFTVFAATLFSAGLAGLFNRIYYSIGDIVRNNFLGGYLRFEEIPDILDNLFLYTTILFKINDAGFTGVKALSPETLFLFLHALVVLAAIGIVVYRLIGFFKGTDDDTISVLLSLSFAMISAVLILTNIMIDEMAARYCCFIPVIFAVLIVRYIDHRLITTAQPPNNTLKREQASDWMQLIKEMAVPISEKRPQSLKERAKKGLDWAESRKHTLVLGAAALVMIIGCITPFSFSTEPVETEQSQLADFLAEQGLKNGYGEFWDASSVSVASGNAVTVRAVVRSGESFKKYNWFCKGEWYNEPAEFVVIRKSGGEPSAENTVKAFGEPTRRLEYGNYRIFVYNKDLSKELKQ